MRFARRVFRVAAVYGVVVLLPMYFLFDAIGEKDPPAITHPTFFYGFVGVALVFQSVFWVIGGDPVRYRALMIPSVLEKLSFFVTVLVLFLQSRAHSSDLVFPSIDCLLGGLFLASYFKTPVHKVLGASP
jgi:hypothetical protein